MTLTMQPLRWPLCLPNTCVQAGRIMRFADRGEGFCVFNDIAVSAAYAMDVHKIERILVIDLGAAPSV